MNIVKQYVPVGHINRSGTKITPICCVVHYTANDSPKATDTANVKYISRAYELALYKDSAGNIIKGYIEAGTKNSQGVGTKFRYASAHWFIDEDSATLAIPQTEEAYNCGDRPLPYTNGYKGRTKFSFTTLNDKPNKYTIGYEICNNGDWTKACANAAKIIAQDMITYNIPITMVVRHHDVTGKNCPKPMVDSESAWLAFKKLIETELKTLMVKEVIDMFNDEAKIATWAKDSVTRMVNLGIFTVPTENPMFRPTDPISRQEIAVVLDRFAKLLGK